MVIYSDKKKKLKKRKVVVLVVLIMATLLANEDEANTMHEDPDKTHSFLIIIIQMDGLKTCQTGRGANS